MESVKFDLSGVSMKCNGGLRQCSAKPYSFTDALGKWGANSGALLKTVGTGADLVRFATGDRVGVCDLGELKAGCMAAGSAASISSAWVATAKTVGSLQKRKYQEALPSAVKAAGETAATLVNFQKMGGLDITSETISLLKCVKESAAVVSDCFELSKHLDKGAELEKRAKCLKRKVTQVEKNENWYATVKIVMGIMLHSYMFLGGVVGLPIMPVAITLLGVLYISAITVWHFAKERADAELMLECAGMLSQG